MSDLHHPTPLRLYVRTLPHGGAADLARRLGITQVYLCQLAARQDGRVPSPALATRIERVTGGAVTRRELRPDWASIWPELAEAA